MTQSGIDRIHKLRRQMVRNGKPPAKAPGYGGSLWETYRRLYPRYLSPEHLRPVFDLFERAKHERVYATISLPPRAGKTETLIAAINDRLLMNAETRVGYASYSARLAEKKSYRARGLALQHGIPIDPTSRSKKDWRTGIEEGGLWATSVGGSITGEGFELMILDDLISGRMDAERQQVRDDTHSWIMSDVLSRMEPEGSVILCGTRYHLDDPIGRVVASGAWEELVIPALTPGEESYWAERWTAERLLEKRFELGGKDGYEWRSLYMGDPCAPGDMVFRDAHLVDDALGDLRIAIGVDFAYTTNKSSDYSVAVVLAQAGGLYYVIDVLRLKVPEAEFRGRVKVLAEQWGAQYVVGYIAATEQPNIDLLAQEMPAFGLRAVADKKTRALPTAAGWNLGRIKVLGGRPWTKDFVSEVVGFTGSDRHDDQVDALTAVYDSMHASGEIDWKFIGELQAAAPVALSIDLN
jgi:predicted phage terminase large subunit-like protein